ncbi:DUF2007 domain-containing protein [Kibdelosporangium phytohabitans]|nr:DUF2007 domain-containing protein [Kibdelosporangium phytohabitans]MBE1470017.1 hypothetical protein [Kibdelosporangium phytohabitans]
MIELLRSNDPVLMSFAASVLKDAGIEHNHTDSHMSVIDGSIGALQQRLLVAEDRRAEAERLLTEAGVRLTT